ncbi:Leucine-rich repeat and immunoglobulin-like domain-containing nogo receptor-interacting protein 1 [Triplophysa tibetana]|nr:Leucine-rich repeat and immunoglobulin-like domain-containing nogo receptor-interacting protein 1 [Triplophysa tibetana]
MAADWRRLHRWVVLLWLVGVALVGSCDQRCDCPPTLLAVNCSSRHLTRVPDGLPQTSVSLNLSHNVLKSLMRRQFSSLTLLRDLDLSHNTLSVIEVDAFLGLHNLGTLTLSDNRLKIIPVGAFTGLPNVRRLDISENDILVFLDDTFREMPSLQTLEVSENDVVFVSSRTFGGLLNLQELNIDRCNLTSVPVEALSLLAGLSRLRLCRMSLSSLANNSFRQLSRLSDLHVSHCPRLSSLAVDSLMGLNLSSLTLSHCNLTSVPCSPLRHLVYLRDLDLSYNPISSVRSHLLAHLFRLQQLHLDGCGLLAVDPGAFSGLASLRLLHLSANGLVTLEESAFQAVDALEVLRLDGNPLTCDCRLLWVMRRRMQLGFGGHSPTCVKPARVQGRTMGDVTEAELPKLFTCRQARILSRKPQDVRTDEGHAVLFFCEADGDPAPSIFWLNPQRSLLSGSGRIRVLSNGTLEVSDAQVQDSGYYLCVASNAAGNDSVSVSLWVRGSAGSPRDRFYLLRPEGWSAASGRAAVNGSQGSQPFPFDVKTLAIAVTMGFMCFLSSVAVCFIVMFFWSQSKGQIKRTATIEFVPHSSAGAAGAVKSTERGRFTMRLI